MVVSPFDEYYTIGVNYEEETHKGPYLGYNLKINVGNRFYSFDTNNMTTALNIMRKDRWEFVQAYTSPHDIGPEYYESYVCHYILKKSVVTNEK